MLGSARTESDELPLNKPFTVARDGLSINCAVSCEANERKKLEWLCRYMSRPAIAEQRLSVAGDGLVVYELKRSFRDGTTHVLFEPHDCPRWCRDPERTSPDTTAYSHRTPDTAASSSRPRQRSVAPRTPMKPRSASKSSFISQAQCEPIIKRHAMTDDDRWKAMAAIVGPVLFHLSSICRWSYRDQTLRRTSATASTDCSSSVLGLSTSHSRGPSRVWSPMRCARP